MATAGFGLPLDAVESDTQVCTGTCPLPKIDPSCHIEGNMPLWTFREDPQMGNHSRFSVNKARHSHSGGLEKAEKTLSCGQATKGIDCRPCSAVSLGINRVRVMQMGGRSPYPGSFRTLHSCQLPIRKASGRVSGGPGVSKTGLLTFFAKFAEVLVEWHCQTLGGPECSIASHKSHGN